MFCCSVDRNDQRRETYHRGCPYSIQSNVNNGGFEVEKEMIPKDSQLQPGQRRPTARRWSRGKLFSLPGRRSSHRGRWNAGGRRKQSRTLTDGCFRYLTYCWVDAFGDTQLADSVGDCLMDVQDRINSNSHSNRLSVSTNIF